MNQDDYHKLARDIKVWGRELGFQQVGITDTDLSTELPRLQEWLDRGYQGQMEWIAERKHLRIWPEKLQAGAIRVVSARMDYLPGDTQQIEVLKSPDKAYVSRYALGRDYHKLIRKRLGQLATKIEQALGEPRRQRAFVDSAPVMERSLAQKAGLGWVGKHTLIINAQAGSWFFLGEIYTDVPLPLDTVSHKDQCGDCTACLKVCPTDAFPRPYVLDARRCISYLTIEHQGPIPEEFREPMGNRVFGCDDCQAICPWNKYASPTQETDFKPRHNLDNPALLDLFRWTEKEFLDRTAGSPIRRIGYLRWLRNLSVALGNGPNSEEVTEALAQHLDHPEEMIREHIAWALEQQRKPQKRRKRKIKAGE